MNAKINHRLEGLQPDNLLAFMALLGLLRALETAAPAWRPRAYWDETRHPLRPVLTLAEAKTREEVAETAAKGISVSSKSLAQIVARAREFDNANSGKMRSEDAQLELTKNAATLRQLMMCEAKLEPFLSGLATLGSTKSEAPEAISTPLMFPSGQMAFVGTLLSLSEHPEASELQDALFESWAYKHKGETLRLDPTEARRYALQGKDPAPQGAWGERGASSLAVLAFPSFPVFAIRSIEMPGAHWIGRQLAISWPLWHGRSGCGATLARIEAWLRSIGSKQSRGSLGVSGLFAIAETRRIRISDQGNYFNVASAQITLLSNKAER